jgi:glycosyltransferase involved in cell wall biosynthesis
MRVRTVAVVAPYYPPRIGGVERYVARIVSMLALEEDLKPVVLTTGENRFRTRVTVQDGVQVVRLGVWFRVSNTPLSPLWPFQVRRWLRRLGADVVNAHAPVPGLGDIAIAVAGKRPTVVSYHSGSMHKGEAGTGLADWIIDRYERHVLPRVFDRADVVVPCSPAALGAGVPHAVQITPGVDVDRFTPGPPAARRPRDLVYVGRIDHTSAWKGIDVLIKALARLADLPGVRLKLVGDGDAVADHLDLAARLGVAERVAAVGALDGAELVEAIRSAAVLVLPSLTDAEAFGLVLVEAMACATPVVASSVGGPAFVLADGESGLLVPPGDPDALEKACRRLLEDTDLADAMGAAGRRRAEEHFDWPTRLRRYADLFRTLADQAG